MALSDLDEVIQRVSRLLRESPAGTIGIWFLAFAPAAALHYYVSASWLNESLAPRSLSLYDAMSTAMLRSDVPVGILSTEVSAVTDFLSMTAVATSVFMFRSRFRGSRSVLKALGVLGGRRTRVLPIAVGCALAISAIRYGVYFTPLASVGANALLGPLISYVSTFIRAFIVTCAWLLAAGIVVETTAGRRDVTGSVGMVLRMMLGRERLISTLILALGFVVLGVAVNVLSLGSAMILNAVRSPALDTAWFAILNVPLLALMGLSVVAYGMDRATNTQSN